jgi:PKD repeat protein
MIRPSSLNQSLLILLMPVFLFLIGLTQTNAAELILSWQDNSSIEEGFYIERSLGQGGPFEKIATLEPNSTSYVDSSISYEFIYCYTVVAFNSNGSSPSDVDCNLVKCPGSLNCTTDSPPSEGDNSLLSFDFEGYGAGEDPDLWKDTKKNNSFNEDPNLFTTRAVQNTVVFGTDSGDTNIHSHYVGEDALNLSNYTYTGKIYITDSGGGIGTTFLSRFPEELDVYYRLRRYSSKPKFHISAHGTSVKGDKDSGVSPYVDTWYRFRIEVEETGTQTSIRAKIWKEGEVEPEEFQIDAYDDSSSRISSGTVGVWTMGNGTKLFDDLAVLSNESEVPAEPTNNPPVAVFEMPEFALVEEDVFFNAGGSFDPDNDPLSFSWDFGDGSSVAGVTVSHQFADPGTYEVTLTVSDSNLSDSSTSALIVDLPVNSVPVAVIQVGPSNVAMAGETLYFNASDSYDPDGHPLNYTWDFGDNSNATGVEVSHSFSEPGVYEVLLVVDDGQLSGTEIIEIVISGETQSILFSDNFELYEAGEDPADWKDTGKNNSFNEDPALFETKVLGSTIAFGTNSRNTNIHSHYNGEGAVTWANYTYTGRMYVTSSRGGIGLTFLSQYPVESDVYYRLRRYTRKPAFYISPHGTSVKGDKDSGVSPVTNSWYQFRIEVEDTGIRTNIRAKVWKEEDGEPEGFQIDAYDDSSSRITSGTVGVWTMGRGVKLFDDLEVELRQ